MKRWCGAARIGVLLGLLSWLAACSAPLGVGGWEWLGLATKPSATPAALLARRLIPPTPRPTAPPTATKTSTPLPTPEAVSEAPQPEPTLADPPTQAPPEFQICSPLYNILREDLPRLVSEGYHPPPRSRPDDRHHGVDFAYYHWKGSGPIASTGVQAVLAGRAAMALEGTFPYGDVVIVETLETQLPEELRAALGLPPGQSLYLLYAHLQEGSLGVRLGEAVSACQVIGAVGRSGNTDANHLHLETRIGPPGATFSGMSAFTETATDEEKRNYRLWRISGKYQHFDPLKLLLYGLEGVYLPPRLVTPTSDFER
jgi:murein DD-endopeptidase MepM/ murein hydrolase activator NlpD